MNETPKLFAAFPESARIAEQSDSRMNRRKSPILIARLFMIGMLLSVPALSPAQGNGKIHSIAGKLAAAQTGVEATSVPLYAPAGIAFDSAGNLYLADRDNNIIRKVDTSGILTTVAGNGEEGFAGDGGAATDAELDTPSSVAVDANGNLYIADTANNRIREVSGGIITTIAGMGASGYSGDGNPAILCTLSGPTALIIDAFGDLYIADTGNNVIRNIFNGKITTLAGNGLEGFAGDGGQARLASLDSPGGLAIDSSGDIFIADTNNNRIRVVSAGMIKTIAGTGASGRRRGQSKTGMLTPLIAQTVDQPHGLAIDSSGNLFLADSDNNRIIEISSTGLFSTIAGNGTEGYDGDSGSALSATLDTPLSVALTSTGMVAFADTENDRVRMVSQSNVNTVAGIAPPGVESLGISAPDSSVIYGSASISASFHNGLHVSTGSATFADITNGNTMLGSASLLNNQATLSLPQLSAGVHRIVASFSGDASDAPVSSGIYVLTVTPRPVQASATGVSQQYGVAIPKLMGSLTGLLAQDASSVAAAFSTTATSTSAPATYPIAATLTGSGSTNYMISLASDSGSLVITKATTTSTLTLSSDTQFLGLPVDIVAHVLSATSGTPTGNVILSDNGIAIATLPVADGSVAFNVSTLAVGAHTLTASYGGDTDFVAGGATSPAVATISPDPDFTVSADTETSTRTVAPGGGTFFQLALQPQSGPFNSPITLSATGLPSGAAVRFIPATITPGSINTPFVMTVYTSPTNAQLQSARFGPLAFVLLLLPLTMIRRIRIAGNHATFVLVFALCGLAGAIFMSGCGGHSSTQAAKTYIITVTGTAASVTNATLTHSSNVTLIVK